MILVDIFVPTIDNTYDFKLDENTKCGLVKNEIIKLICQKEKFKLEGANIDLFICDSKGRSLLNEEKTLSENGIESGDKLILV